MSKARMPLIKGQDWLIESMKLFDYPSNAGGVCFGVTAKAIPAILLSEVDHFDAHCKHAHRMYLSKESKTQLQYKIKMIRTKTEKEKRQLEKEHEEVPAFMEGIEVGQKAHQHYPHLMGEKNLHVQDMQRIAHLTLPNALIEIGIYNNKTHNFFGAYTVEDFEKYFTSFQLALKQTYPPLTNPIAFELKNTNHAIALGYVPASQEWILIDAGQLPSQRISSSQEIAKKVIEAFSSNKVGLISTTVFCIHNKKDINTLNHLMNHWKNVPDFIELHDISQGNKVFLHDSSNINLLALAVHRDSFDLVKIILKLTPPDHLYIKCSQTLVAAIANNNIEILKELINAGFDIESYNQHGSTPLLSAIMYGNYDIVNFLLDVGANIHVLTNRKYSALSCALKYGHTEIYQLLLSRGAVMNCNTKHHADKPKKPANPQIIDTNTNQTNQYGLTPLMIAAIQGDDERVLELLQSGTKLHAPGECNKTEFMLAAQHGQYYVISVLFEHCLININEVSINNETAISLAALNGHYHVVNQLLDWGAKLNNELLKKILNKPKSKNFMEMFELLLKRNLIPADLRDQYFEIYLRKGYARLISILIEYGKKEIPNEAIQLALELGHQTTARVLLEKKICDYIQERSELEQFKTILTLFSSMGFDPDEKYSKAKKLEAAHVLLAVVRNAMRRVLLDKYSGPLEDGKLEIIYQQCKLAFAKDVPRKTHSLS